MQILHPFAGSIQQYLQQIVDANLHRPSCCPQCQARCPMTAHGFYHRTLVDRDFDESIPIRRYLCRGCRRTISLLPQFALPYLRFSIAVISLFLAARLLDGETLMAAAALLSGMSYQRGQFWIRRFRKQAAALSASLASLTVPPEAADFVSRALRMLEAVGWIDAHRFLFSKLRVHLLGWPAFLAPDGLRTTLPQAFGPT